MENPTKMDGTTISENPHIDQGLTFAIRPSLSGSTIYEKNPSAVKNLEVALSEKKQNTYSMDSGEENSGHHSEMFLVA